MFPHPQAGVSMIKLYNDDCLNILKDIDDKSVDLVITDCPYHIVSGVCSTGAYGDGNGIFTKQHHEPKGILNHRREYERDAQTGRQVLKGTKHINLGGQVLNDNITYTRQGKLFKHNDIEFKDWLPEVYRVLKDNTHCYIMINARNLKDLQVEAEKVGFSFQQILIWDKGNATPNRYYLNAFEMILMLRKGNAKNINNMGTTNIIRTKNIIGNKYHPTEKPVELMEILVENSSNENDLVMDCFMGAGATAIACRNLNRNFIGIEIDERYFTKAQERLEKEKQQLKLF